MKHGGDIYRNPVKLDFSVNINPLGIPERVREALTQAVSECVCTTRTWRRRRCCRRSAG